MNVERSDYEELRRKLETQKREQVRPQLERSIQAAVAAERLTGHSEWDYYLSLIQAEKESAEDRARRAEEVLTGPESAYESLIAAKLALAEARGQAAAYAHALEIPKQIMEQGQQAKAVLSDG